MHADNPSSSDICSFTLKVQVLGHPNARVGDCGTHTSQQVASVLLNNPLERRKPEKVKHLKQTLPSLGKWKIQQQVGQQVFRGSFKQRVFIFLWRCDSATTSPPPPPSGLLSM